MIRPTGVCHHGSAEGFTWNGLTEAFKPTDTAPDDEGNTLVPVGPETAAAGRSG
jgi:hypothetical protein